MNPSPSFPQGGGRSDQHKPLPLPSPQGGGRSDQHEPLPLPSPQGGGRSDQHEPLLLPSPQGGGKSDQHEPLPLIPPRRRKERPTRTPPPPPHKEEEGATNMKPSPSSPQAYTKLPGLTLFLLSCRVLASMSLGSGDSAPWGVLVLWPPASGCGEVVVRLGWVGGVDGGGGARKMGEPLYRRMQHVSGHSSRSLC